MDTNGSIRSSLKGSKTGFQSQSIQPAVLELAKQFLESFQFDLRIRQMLHSDKMEASLAKYCYYVLGNEQKYEPGFLICMKGQPILFVSSRLQFGFSLRLRLHASLYETGAVFVATLDTVHATLRLEDVLYYNGRALNRDTFTKRFGMLQKFYSDSFVQDKRLSGLTVTLADIHPLSELKELVESGQFYSMDLVPEQGGRRRWHIPLSAKPAPSLTNPSTASLPEPTVLTPIGVPFVKDESKKHAYASKITGLPDTFDLSDEKGVAMGKAAVQTAQVSIALRQAFIKSGSKNIHVCVEWYEDFQRYKITGLV